MSLTIFDLDNTLIAGDSDTAWGEFLSKYGHVDPEEHNDKHEKYYQDYLRGELDIMEFLRFQFEFLSRHDMATLHSLRDDYLEEFIVPIILPKAQVLVDEHRRRGNHLLIITATNRFITEPIAGMFGIDNLIATDPEIVDNHYTGNVAGIPSFADGKVTRLKSWMKETRGSMKGSWFYSDSRNDIPLLKEVDNPVAVDPDDHLRDEAKRQNWEIISLR